MQRSQSIQTAPYVNGALWKSGKILPLLWSAIILGLILIPVAFASVPHDTPGDNIALNRKAPNRINDLFQQSEKTEHLEQTNPAKQTEEKAHTDPQHKAETHTTSDQDKTTDSHAAAVDPHVSDQHAAATHEGEQEEHGDSGFLAKLLNFVVLFGGLTFLLRKPISKMLGQRADDIKISMVEAEESNKTANKKLKQGQKRLDEVAVEVKSINTEAEKNGLTEKEEILTAADKEAERLKKLAAQEIANLSQGGIKELKAHAAELATSLARENIQNKIKTADHASFIDKSIERLDALYKERAKAAQ
jgi:F-type H+-transporting ATPase subunit b